MAHDIRPEVSQKNPFWIGKHRYYELKHFCLQYPIWKRARSSLDGLSKRPADLQVFVKSGQMKGDPTERCAQSRLFFAERILLTMYQSRPQLCQSVRSGVSEVYGEQFHVFERPIEYSIKVAECPAAGQSILSYAPKNAAAESYRSLAREVLHLG